MRSARAFIPVTLVLCFAASVHAEVTVTALDTSSRVLKPGDHAELQLRLYNAVATPLDGVLTVELTDFEGCAAASATKPVSVLAGDDRLVTVFLAAPKAGYFSVDVTVKNGDAAVFDKDRVWSVAVLNPSASMPENSPFGTYTIGNTVMLADIVPKGFYDDMARIGARWGTVDTWWSRIEITEGNCDWDFYGQWFQKALTVDIVPIPHLFGVPKWASSQPDKENFWAYPPRDWAVWERFVEAFVTRHQDWLRYLRIWNEPNCGYWQGTPADYAQLVIHASQAAKRVKPGLKIMIEAVANPALEVIPFFDAVDAAGATPFWDVLSIHNYWLNSREVPERTNFLKVYRDVIAWRDAHKPGAELWDTEFACMADDWGTEWKGVGETKQAQWLARAHVLGFALGLKKMFWFPGYSWPDPTTAPHYNPAGLLRADLSPRPAYVAYHTIAVALARAQYDHTLSLGPDQLGVVFKVPEGFVTALWSVDTEHGGDVALNLGGGGKATRTTLMGEREEMAVSEDGMLTVRLGESMALLATESAPHGTAQ